MSVAPLPEIRPVLHVLETCTAVTLLSYTALYTCGGIICLSPSAEDHFNQWVLTHSKHVKGRTYVSVFYDRGKSSTAETSTQTIESYLTSCTGRPI